MTVYMVRDQPVPYECYGDPVAVFSSRELADNYVTTSGVSGLWVEEWEVDETLASYA